MEWRLSVLSPSLQMSTVPLPPTSCVSSSLTRSHPPTAPPPSPALAEYRINGSVPTRGETCISIGTTDSEVTWPPPRPSQKQTAAVHYFWAPGRKRQAVQTVGGVKVAVLGSEGKGSCNGLLFLTDRTVARVESEAAARPLRLHANEISTAAVSVWLLITQMDEGQHRCQIAGHRPPCGVCQSPASTRTGPQTPVDSTPTRPSMAQATIYIQQSTAVMLGAAAHVHPCREREKGKRAREGERSPRDVKGEVKEVATQSIMASLATASHDGRQGSLRQRRQVQSNTAEQGRRTDKREVHKGLFPPGFSSRVWQRSEAASLILPPGQSLASSPDGGEQGGERRDQEEIDDWFLTTHPVAESHSPPHPHPPVMCQAWPGRPDAPIWHNGRSESGGERRRKEEGNSESSGNMGFNILPWGTSAGGMGDTGIERPWEEVEKYRPSSYSAHAMQRSVQPLTAPSSQPYGKSAYNKTSLFHCSEAKT
ncbi:unnamed protein product [Pleuronectes platessa]|uniref:Uncharacterized protein n=1 Tax=Pleuronectes platessa TaxID=8262 RepID=A0A9N7Z3J3_PLEPL|nr:unnamed protein product [Pleuronectes platessa]